MKLALIVAFAAFVAGPASADPYAVGSQLPVLELEDQHGTAHTVDETVRRVLVTRDMDAGRIAKAALEEAGAPLLEELASVYVSDVSRMPGVIRSLFAMPSLRRRPYPILLDLDGLATADVPSEDGKVTVIDLESLRIARIRYLGESEAVLDALR